MFGITGIASRFTPGVSGGGAAPTLSGANYALGDVLGGGQSIVLTGTNFSTVVGASGVTFLGTNATSYTVNSSTQITATLPAHAAGTGNIVVTNPSGSATFAFEYVDPTAFYDLWLEGPNYSAGTWTARKGSNATTVGSDPTTGTNLGTLATVDFASASSQYLHITTGLLNYIQTTSWMALCVFNARSISTNSVTDYLNVGLMQEIVGQNWGIQLMSGGPSVENYHWDGAAKHDNQTIALNTWECSLGKYDGTKIYSRLGSGAWSAGTVAGSNIVSGTNGLNVGNGNSFFDGRMAILALVRTPPTDANVTKIIGAINQRWGQAF